MKGYIEQRGKGFRLMVYTGRDPITGKKRYRTETVRGTKRQAQKLYLPKSAVGLNVEPGSTPSLVG